MATILENISSINVIARTTISAVYRTAQIIAAIPNLSYQNRVEPFTNYIILELSSCSPYFNWCPIFLFFFLSIKILGFPRGFISSVASSYDPSRSWNTSWSSPDFLCCPCAIFHLPSFVFILNRHEEDYWFSKNTLKNCFCIFFIGCPVWKTEWPEDFFMGKLQWIEQRKIFRWGRTKKQP